MEYILKTINLTKKFDSKIALDNVNIGIKKGEIYGFLGPNGAGKTTLMKVVTNILKATSGEIEIFEQKITNKSYEYLGRLGVIIENPVFYDNLTAVQNLDLHCEYMGYNNETAIQDAINLVNLKDIDNKIVKNFSLGMRQRLGLARAILTKPELLILDEPINGLDPVGVKEIRDLIMILSKEYGITIFISSHILSEIEQIADTIGVINNGKIIKEVAMQDIRNESREYIEVTVSDVKKAAFVLESKLNYKNIKVINESIRIYDENIKKNGLIKSFLENEIEIELINDKNSSLEEYFLKLLAS